MDWIEVFKKTCSIISPLLEIGIWVCRYKDDGFERHMTLRKRVGVPSISTMGLR